TEVRLRAQSWSQPTSGFSACSASPMCPRSGFATSSFGVHDMIRMQRVGEPHPSPDGQWVVFTVRSWDAESNKTTTNLWLVSIDGSKLRQLTSAKGQADTSPTWSPDNRTIAFVSGRSGSRQIWTIALDG